MIHVCPSLCLNKPYLKHFEVLLQLIQCCVDIVFIFHKKTEIKIFMRNINVKCFFDIFFGIVAELTPDVGDGFRILLLIFVEWSYVWVEIISAKVDDDVLTEETSWDDDSVLTASWSW
jgi:hypothetical protein